MRIDHVLLAARDIDAAAQRLLRQYGLSSLPGGTHPAWGTGNRIVPLGGPYLEIIGVVDPPRAAAHPLGQWIQQTTVAGDVLGGLMVEPDDFDSACARLSLTPIPGERARPDGTTASWRLAGVNEAITQGMPCFISWSDRDEVFGGDAGIGASGITELELGGDLEQIRLWLGGDTEGLRLVGGAPGIRRLTIPTAGGELVVPEYP